MRIFFALAALATLSACRITTEPYFGDSQSCGAGYSWSKGACTRNYQPPIITVITIGPARVYSDSGDVMCYALSPSPVSVRAGGSYRFQNNTGVNITIVDSNQIPWVTIDGYATSSALGASGAGVYGFGIQGCRGIAGTAWYGVLDVTLN